MLKCLKTKQNKNTHVSKCQRRLQNVGSIAVIVIIIKPFLGSICQTQRTKNRKEQKVLSQKLIRLSSEHTGILNRYCHRTQKIRGLRDVNLHYCIHQQTRPSSIGYKFKLAYIGITEMRDNPPQRAENVRSSIRKNFSFKAFLHRANLKSMVLFQLAVN